MSNPETSRNRSGKMSSSPTRNGTLEPVYTNTNMSIPPELFEQMYLTPKTTVKGDLRHMFGNPTPMALAGFLLCTTPLSMILLGWQGASGLGQSNVGSYFFLGGVLMILGGIGEWILGNTFPATVFSTFGGFFLTFGAALVPSYNAYAAYSPDQSNPAAGLNSNDFHSSFGFFLVSIVLMSTIYCVASIRTNVIFFLIFLIVIPSYSCLAAAFFALANDNTASALTFQYVGAGLLLTVSFLGWYEFTASILLCVDFPYRLPLGDLSTHIKGYEERMKRNNTAKGKGSPV